MQCAQYLIETKPPYNYIPSYETIVHIFAVNKIIVKPWPQTLSPKTKGPWADTKISWATTPPHNF